MKKSLIIMIASFFLLVAAFNVFAQQMEKELVPVDEPDNNVMIDLELRDTKPMPVVPSGGSDIILQGGMPLTDNIRPKGDTNPLNAHVWVTLNNAAEKNLSFSIAFGTKGGITVVPTSTSGNIAKGEKTWGPAPVTYGLTTANAGWQNVDAKLSGELKGYDKEKVAIVGIDHIQHEGINVEGTTIAILLYDTPTFTATPNPAGVSWPSGWPKWSGDAWNDWNGVPPNPTESTILTDVISTGTKDLTVSCGNSSKTVTITIVQVDIDTDSNNDGTINDADDPIEENSPGRVVAYNGDDDNVNLTPDRDETGTVTGENDLAEATLSYDASLPNGYKVVLEASSGNANIKVWESATKGIEIVLPRTYVIGYDTIPSTIYVEGYNIGEAMLDMILKDNADYELERDTVKFTVVQVEIITAGEYIVPGSGNNAVQYKFEPSGYVPTAVNMEVYDKDLNNVRIINNISTTYVGSYIQQLWDGEDGSGNSLSESQSPFKVKVVAVEGSNSFSNEINNRKVKEWITAIIIGDKPTNSETLITGVDEDTINVSNFKVKVKFYNELGETQITAYQIDSDVESPIGPPGNEWDADVWLKENGSDYYTVYTTPSTPIDIKYEINLQEEGDMILDGVLNKWDLDEGTSSFETKGKWIFGVNSDGKIRDFVETYE